MDFFKWLSISDRYTKMQFDRALATLGLNSSQHMYILKVCQTPGITQDQFFSYFYIHPSNITRSLAFLEKEGFLRKEPHNKDKRTCCLFPTEKGIQANEEILSIQRNWYQTMLYDFTEEERTLLESYLKRTTNNVITALSKDSSSESN